MRIDPMLAAAALLALAMDAVQAAIPPTAPQLPPGAVNAEGLRDHDYRSPPPPSVAEATTIDTAELRQLMAEWGERLVLLDVMAVPKRPPAPGQSGGGSWIPNKVRQHIAGSVWLPNVGYARLPPEMEQFYREHLERLSGGDMQRPIVLYCLEDCWMSWNAVRRAARYGYRNLYWYRAGTDGWQRAGLPLIEAEPVPPPEAAAKQAQ
ncbi:MAG TPA: rhodanese-like domain-containing protein [Candidatus Competibacteraceae bacterium]|nr:rhodanese-like domain-containing protein [Candidatus Competibacteraceae bacterium]